MVAKVAVKNNLCLNYLYEKFDWYLQFWLIIWWFEWTWLCIFTAFKRVYVISSFATTPQLILFGPFLIICWFKERYSLPAPFYSCLFCSNSYFKIVGLSRFNYICYVSYCLVTSTVPELISDVIFLHLSLLTPRFLGCKKNVRHHAINQFTVDIQKYIW